MTVALSLLACLAATSAGAQTVAKDALLFHASFDRSLDADFAKGDPRLYTAAFYKAQQEAKPGLITQTYRSSRVSASAAMLCSSGARIPAPSSTKPIEHSVRIQELVGHDFVLVEPRS